MAQPNDYNLNLPDPTQNVLGALSMGGGLIQLKSAQEGLKKAEVANRQAAQMQSDLTDLSTKNSPAAVASMMIKYPSLSEGLKRGFDAMTSQQKDAKIGQASQVYASLLNGDTDTAYSTLKNYATAYRNSGMAQDADSSDALAEIIKLHPDHAQTTAGLYLASAMGPDKFQETFSKLESERREANLEPSALTKAQAEAREAATKANFAESNAVVDLQKKGWDIYKIQEDVNIAKENNRIAALNAAANRETNDLKRQELQDKLKDAQTARDQKVRDTAATVEQGRSTIDNSLSTIDRILKNPALNDVLGSVQGSAVGEVVNTVNPLKWNSDDRANVNADIETLKSQTFLNQLMQLKNSSGSGASGLGALSEREGDRLINGLQSLHTKQGEEQFKSNMKEIQRLLLKSREGLVKKYGVPDTIPDTPNAAPSAAEIDALVKKHGG